MKFLVPNYSCLQNPWLGSYLPPYTRSVCPLSSTEFVEPLPNKIRGYATATMCTEKSQNSSSEATEYARRSLLLSCLLRTSLLQNTFKRKPALKFVKMWEANTTHIILHQCLTQEHFLAFGQSHWPRSLRRWSAAAGLLGLWVRIPPWTRKFFCCVFCVLSGNGLWDGPITRTEEPYRLRCVVVCDLETSWIRRLWPTEGCRVKNKDFS